MEWNKTEGNKKEWNKTEKKQLIIYCIISYGITYLLGILMWYGQKNGMDVSAFPNAQMMYPAAGVMLAYLVTNRKDDRMPKLFYLVFLIVTAFLIVCAVLSIVRADDVMMIGMNMAPLWTYLQQIAFMVASILGWILLAVSGRVRRKAYGLNSSKWKLSILMIVLFTALYFLRTLISYGISGEMSVFLDIMAQPNTWIYLAVLPVNFLLVAAPFFGEEYGWRYYLQPLLQKKFGPRGGVIILGIVWGLWHLPVDFFYYSPGYGLQAALSQQITCITLGIFFAYAYMKTNNIWVPVILHFINNNLAPVITGTFSADALKNQVITWGSLIPALIINGILFGGFILSKVFSQEE